MKKVILFLVFIALLAGCSKDHDSNKPLTMHKVEVTTGFTPRSFHTCVYFNDALWVLGGLDDGGRTASVYSSSDGGVTWELREAIPQALLAHASVVFNGIIWTSGGTPFVGAFSDIVYGSNDAGGGWSEKSSGVFEGRTSHTTTVFNNQVWMLGGYNNTSGVLGDVWHSVNGGDFTQEVGDNFGPHSGHSCEVYNNRLWVFGGFVPSGYSDELLSSTDGINYEVVSQGEIMGRSDHGSAVFDDKVWVIAGDIEGAGYTNDIQYYDPATDTWTAFEAPAGFTPRYGLRCVVANDKLYIIGGDDGSNLLNEVWVIE